MAQDATAQQIPRPSRQAYVSRCGAYLAKSDNDRATTDYNHGLRLELIRLLNSNAPSRPQALSPTSALAFPILLRAKNSTSDMNIQI